MDLGGAVQQYGYPVVFVGSLLEGEKWVIAIAAFGGFLGDQRYFVLGRRFDARLLHR